MSVAQLDRVSLVMYVMQVLWVRVLGAAMQNFFPLDGSSLTLIFTVLLQSSKYEVAQRDSEGAVLYLFASILRSSPGCNNARLTLLD